MFSVVTKYDGSIVCTSKFKKPTSAPLIALVVTIAVPLLYHVRTYYIVHYNSQTTHASQPTPLMNSKKAKEKEIKEDSKKKQSNKNMQFTFSARIRLGLRNPRKKERQILRNNNHSYSSIHYQHTNTSLQNNIHVSKVHCGSAFEPGASLLLHTTFVRS